ncbi:MAG TPA: phosphatidate cytidylyltransferase [Bacillota bacterium]
MLRTRLLTAAVGIPLIALALAMGRDGLAVLAAVVAVAASEELASLLRRGQRGVPVGIGALLALAAQWAARSSAAEQAAASTAAAVVGGWLVVTAILVLRSLGPRPVDPTALSGAGWASALLAVYIAWPLALWPSLYALGEARGGGSGWPLALLPLAVGWTGDAAAYFVGLAWGRRRLAPALSPRKSVEGALAGLAGAGMAGLALASLLPWSVPTTLGVALVAGVAAQVGDLWESTLKRAAGAKDSGTIVPGHGGVLDRFDGIVFAVPVVYYAALWWS